MEGSGSPLASLLTLPGKTDVEEDGDMAAWSSSRSCDSAERPQWHRLQGTLRGHLTFNPMKATALRFFIERHNSIHSWCSGELSFIGLHSSPGKFS